MPNLADLLRDSALGKAMTGARYGERDPYVEATREATSLGYPQPGATADEGEAQRYMASKLAAGRMGPLPLLTNPLHEAALSWFAEGEGKPSLKRLLAGYRGTFDALEAPPAVQPPVSPGFGLQGSQVRPAGGQGSTIQALLASMMAGR